MADDLGSNIPSLIRAHSEEGAVLSAPPPLPSSHPRQTSQPTKPLPDPIMEKMEWGVGPFAYAIYSFMAKIPTAMIAQHNRQQRLERENRDARYLSLNQKILSWMHASTPLQQTEQRAQVLEILQQQPNLQTRIFATLEPFAVSGTKTQAQMAWNFMLEVTGKTSPVTLENLLHDMSDMGADKEWSATHRQRMKYWNMLTGQGLQRAPRSIETQVKAANKGWFGLGVLAIHSIGRSREEKKFAHTELHDPNKLITHDYASHRPKVDLASPTYDVKEMQDALRAVARNITAPVATPQREMASPAASFYMMPHL